jgi:hypothetical protein
MPHSVTATFNSVPKPVNLAPGPPRTRPSPSHGEFTRVNGHLKSAGRVYKPRVSRGPRPANRNMTLDNSRRPFQSVSSLDPTRPSNLTRFPRARRLSTKRMKYSDKPCPQFTTTGPPSLPLSLWPAISHNYNVAIILLTLTGACGRGLTCPYQHDPSKIAICWNFLQGNCPNTADTCNLSHEPTPERTPLCMHFANNGRCTRDKCLFPHVRVAARQGVCRDFAVLGYCAKALDCDKQHVRECPDFAEKGTCMTKGCKLPHVIRANRNRKPARTTSTQDALSPSNATESAISVVADDVSSSSSPSVQLGDEYISLTFNESESSDGSSESEDGEDEEEPDDG